MATVLVGAYGANPATIWPDKYSSCFWNFVTGWTCETVEQSPQQPLAEQPLGNTPDPNASPMLSASTGCGCCGGTGGVPSPLAMSIATATGTTTTVGAKKCNCGYTNREAFWAVVAALVFFILLRE